MNRSQAMIQTEPVHVDISGVTLEGDLAVPAGAHGLILFAHGSGSSRFSPRNRYVAEALDRRSFATLLLDLLTPREEATDRRTAHLRFDVELLATRLVEVCEWIRRQRALASLRIGLFGASTGAGAALIAAATRPDLVAAIVSRGGRPDLAGPALPLVTAPTLLIVGERDETVVQLNNDAMHRMRTEVRLELVPGATHLFEEPGTLERAAGLAGEWFDAHMTSK